MKNWCRKYYINVILVGLVAAIGVVAACLYINQFGTNGFSKKPEDWANFATYISGTVGVAAVVATLIAFVITLSQQKELIDSQKRQIGLMDEQNQSSRISMAHFNALNVFPEMLNNANNELHKKLKERADNDYREALIRISRENGELDFKELKFGDYFYGAAIFKLDIYVEVRGEDVKVVVERILRSPSKVVDFCSYLIDQDDDLFHYFDSKMKDYSVVINCYFAFKLGQGLDEEEKYKFRLMRLNSEDHEMELLAKKWYDLGLRFKEMGL